MVETLQQLPSRAYIVIKGGSSNSLAYNRQSPLPWRLKPVINQINGYESVLNQINEFEARMVCKLQTNSPGAN